LGKSLHEAIAQHFADGGDVQRDANGVAITPEDNPWSVGGALSGAVDWSKNALGMGPSPDELRMKREQAFLASLNAPKPAPPVDPAAALMGAASAGAPVPTAPAAQPTPSPAPAEQAAPAPAPAPAAPKPPAARGMGGAPAGPGDSDIEAASNQEIAAQRDLAAMERNRYAALQVNQESANKSQQAIWEQAQVGLKANLDAQNKLMNDISNQKLDFNGYWSNKSAPAQITAAIGMILGGIGSGMTMGRQGNMAADVINKAIDRDVEQQKAELGKKENMLSHLMEQGHSLQQATTLLMAHDSAVAEGQMKAVADKYAGLETAPLLQKTIAEINQARIDKTIKVHQERADLALKGVQIRHGQMENALLGDQAALMPLQRQIAAASARGEGLPPEYAPFMPADKTVKLDDGKLYVTASPEARKEVAETQQLAAHLRDVAQRIKAFRAQHSGGTMLPNSANDQGLELQNEAKATVAELSKKIRLTGQTGEEMKSFISNPAKFFTTDERVNAQADALIERATREVNAAVRAQVMNAAGGNVSQPGLTITRAK
jgi:hypothetical protein